MALMKLPNSQSIVGAFYVQKKVAGLIEVSGEVVLDLAKVGESRKKTIITALKRGYSRGNEQSEQYLIYAAVCKMHGLKHSKVSNSRYNYVAVPNEIHPREFQQKVEEMVKPIRQLVEEEQPYWRDQWYLGQQNLLGQAVICVRKPSKVPMNVFGKLMIELQGSQDQTNVKAAVEFVKSNGKIMYKF